MNDAARMGLIARAVAHLEGGGVIAFPTETVFGLGADAHSAEAIERVYALKGRDAARVMSLHVADGAMARRYAGAWPDAAARLAAKFWPGALTIVVAAKRGEVSERAIGADGTVGLRCPATAITREIIASFGRAIVGTSANRSGEPASGDASGTRAVFGSAEGLFVVDDPDVGAASGVASTVVSLAEAGRVRILREGGISTAELGL